MAKQGCYPRLARIKLILKLLKEISNRKVHKEVADMFRMGRKVDHMVNYFQFIVPW